MISVRNISKAFGDQVLLKGASLQLNAGDRYAIVGPNGSGKSTFLKILLGMEEPDGGSIQLKKGVTFGYLPQETAPTDASTVLEEALAELPAPDGRDEARAKEILMGLGFRIADFHRKLSELSGGWAMRAAMARLLVQQPDALLLDEPTNHLDLDSLLWLEDWLSSYPGALLTISHDRDFINKTTSAIISFEHGDMKMYYGDYAHFVEEYEAARARLEYDYYQQQNELKKMQEFVDRNRVRMSTAARAQSVLKKMEKMEIITLPPSMKSIHLSFPQPDRTGLKALKLSNISKSYGENKVYDNFSFELERGQKLALVGRNGAGKSTLLKLLAGVIQPDSGERELGLNVRTGYYSQHRLDMLDPNRTVFEEAMNCPRMNAERTVRTILGTFLFSGDAVYKKVKYLSGGEKSRLALVKLLLDPPNVLLLDEPTTHLDLASVEALSGALVDFDGTVCCISHDVFFLNSMANNVAHVEGGKVTLYPGNYEYFAHRQASAHQESTPAPLPPLPEEKAEKPSYEQMQEEKAQRRGREREIQKLDKEIASARKKVEELTAKMSDPSMYSKFEEVRRLGDEIKELNSAIDGKELEKLELEHQ